MAVAIEHLFAHKRFITLVAGWIYNEFWLNKPGYSVETFENLLRQANSSERIPLSLVALRDGHPLGTINLIQCDSERRPHLFPWLAALYVDQPHRSKKVGSLLVTRLVAEAKRLGYKELFLGTDIPSFYSQFGASVYEQFEDKLCIMRIDLTANGQPKHTST
jgi:predicted N-acetyltransferase YhbS